MTKAFYPLAAALLAAIVGCSNGWWGEGNRRQAEGPGGPATPEPGVSPPSVGELRNGFEAPRPVAPTPGTPGPAVPEIAGPGGQAPAVPEPVLPGPSQTAQAPEPVLPQPQTAQAPTAAEGQGTMAPAAASAQTSSQGQAGQIAQAPEPVLPRQQPAAQTSALAAGQEAAAPTGAFPQVMPRGRAGQFARAPGMGAGAAAPGQSGVVTRGYRPVEETRGQGPFVPDDIFAEPASRPSRSNASSRRARPGYEEPLIEVIP